MVSLCFLPRLVVCCRENSISPCELVFGSGEGEGGTRDLLGVEAVVASLRIILGPGEGVFEAFGLVDVAESMLVLELGLGEHAAFHDDS